MPDRQPIVAGRFYPAIAGELKEEVNKFTVKTSSDAVFPLMFVLPHAGYIYCGRIIGETLAKVSLPDILIMLGPNHTGRGAPLAVWPDGNWLTPIGPAKVAEETAAMLIKSGGGFTSDTQAHLYEHSLEVLLPFLQNQKPGISIVPITVSLPYQAALQKAGLALAGVISQAKEQGASIGMLASSDMNHFANQEATVEKDSMAIKELCDLNPDGLLHTVVSNSISMCGVCPASLALYASLELGAQNSSLVSYGTSAEAGGDFSRVVGYAGVIIY